MLRIQRSSLLHDAMEGFDELKERDGQQILKTNLQLTFVDDQVRCVMLVMYANVFLYMKLSAGP